MVLLLFKLLATPPLILAATLVSRRFGQATGGWLVGLPLTSGPIAVFLAIEYGAGFARLAAAGSLAGTTAEACFALAYARLAASHRCPACLFGGSAAFVASGLLLTTFARAPFALFAIAIASLVAGIALLGRPATTAAEVEAPRWDLPLRIAVATALVLVITSIASVIGPDLSGLAAAFPLFATVLGVFAHRHDGAPAAQSVMRGLLLGLFGFAGLADQVPELLYAPMRDARMTIESPIAAPTASISTSPTDGPRDSTKVW